jgi:hypothetical protein
MVARIAGVLLIVAGVLALVYGGFDVTKKTHDVKLGPIEFAVKQQERFTVPVWAGVGAIAAGVLLLLVGGRRK